MRAQRSPACGRQVIDPLFDVPGGSGEGEVLGGALSSFEEASCLPARCAPVCVQRAVRQDAVIVFEVADDWLNGGSSGVAFSLFSLVMSAELWTYLFGDNYVGSADVFDSAIAFIDKHTVESFSSHGGGLFEGGFEGGAVVEVFFEADKETITPLSRSIVTEALRPNLPAAGRLILLVGFAFGNAARPGIVQRIHLVLIVSLLLQHAVDKLQFFGIEKPARQANLALEVAQQAACDGFDPATTLLALLHQAIAAGA